MRAFTYDYKTVRTEASIWILESEDIDWITENFCSPNDVLSLNTPIGDYFCRELTKKYEQPERNPYKAKNRRGTAKFDTLPIVLPRILGMMTDELNNRFSDEYYYKVLPDTFIPSLPEYSQSQDTQRNKPELTRIRVALLLHLSGEDYRHNDEETLLLDRLKAVIPAVLIDGIKSDKERGEEFEDERLEFWKKMRKVLGMLYSESMGEYMHGDSALIAEKIEKSAAIPSLLPAGGYYKNLFQVIGNEENNEIPLESSTDPEDPTGSALQDLTPDNRSTPQDEEVVNADDAAAFETLFPFLINFFSADAQSCYRGTGNRAAQRNAWERAPQNAFILLRYHWHSDDLTTFNFGTGKPSNVISNGKDFNKLKNQASRFLDSPVDDNPKLSNDLLDPNPNNSDKQYGKNRAIYEILSLALDKQNAQKKTEKQKAEDEKSRQLKNIEGWILRDFKILLKIWLKSRAPKIHNGLHDRCEMEKDKEVKHPLLRIFEHFELKDGEKRVRLKSEYKDKRKGKRKAESESFTAFFTATLEAYEASSNTD